MSGDLIWKFYVGNDTQYCQPVIDADKVYMASHSSMIYCLNAISGSIFWSKNVNCTVFASPVPWHGKIIINSLNHVTLCLNASTRDVIWSITTGGADSPPIISDVGKTYIDCLNDTLMCVNISSGNVIWQYALVGANYMVSMPTIFDDKICVGIYPDNCTYLINAETGILVGNWFKFDRIPKQPLDTAYASGFIYASCVDGGIYCFNASTGDISWHYIMSGIPFSIAIANGHVFVSNRDGYLYCFAMILAPDNTASIAIIVTGITSAIAIGVIVVIRKKIHPKRYPRLSMQSKSPPSDNLDASQAKLLTKKG